MKRNFLVPAVLALVAAVLALSACGGSHHAPTQAQKDAYLSHASQDAPGATEKELLKAGEDFCAYLDDHPHDVDGANEAIGYIGDPQTVDFIGFDAIDYLCQ